MTWYTDGVSELITDGNRVVGSCVCKPTVGKEDTWRVEIMWSGPGGDIVGDFDSFEKALAFIHGVEQAFQRFAVRQVEI